jgi:ABC-type glycerol-3-phosphate transport system permease component
MWLVVVGCVAAAFAVAVAGGYGLGWTWTGFEDNNTLWEWLELLVLPIVIAVLPFWYRTHQRLEVEWRIAGIVAGVAAVVVLFGGYVLDWAWTGFNGKTLWDWLELLVLPATLAVLPLVLASNRRDDRRLLLTAVIAVVALAVCALGGYLLDWDWTGFQGNTLWDWIHLLLVPFLVPAALIWITVERRAPEPT